MYISVYTMDSLGRASHRTNYTNNVRISLPYKVEKLQYSGPANPLICKRECKKKNRLQLARTFGSATNHRDLLVAIPEKVSSFFGGGAYFAPKNNKITDPTVQVTV